MMFLNKTNVLGLKRAEDASLWWLSQPLQGSHNLDASKKLN